MGSTYFIVVCIVLTCILAWQRYQKIKRRPKYKVLEKKGSIEIRQYEPYIIAQIDVHGNRKESIKFGFVQLARYIFGENETSKKIPMTSPVLQEENPPFWNIRFIMPNTYAYNEIPKAKNKSVTLKKIKSPMFVSIKFTGDPKDQKLRKKTDELKAFIREKKLNVLPKPIYAFYNPPWTLPILRRNEIWYELRNL